MVFISLLLYSILLTCILLYSFLEFQLALSFLRRRRAIKTAQPLQEHPFVTIQLPVYNEAFVIEDLLEATARLHYPKDRYEIQLLDDSTDETSSIAARTIQTLRAQGIMIHHLRRQERSGFKAGALAEGFKTAQGEFIAIFDADFHPHPEFLVKTLPYFQDKQVGLVQTRWGHHNKYYSLITRLQAFALDAHFTIEQVGRYVGRHFMSFNGTAGIWRKACIENSGGWHTDTLTEDLDLSYRAQLNNWQFIYDEDIISPAELPVDINGFKAQQFRWSKGAAECARKHLPAVLRHRSLRFMTKLHALCHLLNSAMYLCILGISLLSFPIIYFIKTYPEYQAISALFVIFYGGLFFAIFNYFVSEWSSSTNKIFTFLEFLFLFPIFLSIFMGLSFSNSIGVIEGYLGKKSSFIRTAKFNLSTQRSLRDTKKYLSTTISPVVVVEGLFCGFFLWCFLQVVSMDHYAAYPHFMMLCFGFGFVFCSSLYHALKARF